MLCVTTIEKNDFVTETVFASPRYNQIWGADYMLMDSNAFMGGTGGSKYETIIDTFVKIWDVQGKSVLNAGWG